MALHYEAIHWLNYSNYEDLRFYEIGHQKCEPNYDYGPIIRDKYILHYVVRGKGRLEMDGQVFPVESKQAFVIPAGVLCYYQADSAEPWEYIWLQFHGPKAVEILQKAGITRKAPVFIPNASCSELENCLFAMLDNPFSEYATMGKLYEFLQQLITLSSHSALTSVAKDADVDTGLHYVRMVIQYIREKYSEPIHIQEIADYCGLDRSYLGKLFKTATGQTPQKYLMTHRMKRAGELLLETDMPIRHVGFSVGYNDPLAFSKVFKQETGFSPSEYRLNMKNGLTH